MAALAGPRVLAGFQPCIVNRKTICVSGLPAAFNGIRVALLSDFHHGKLVSSQMIRDSVWLANSLEPDLIALTGDYVHRGKEWVGACFRELADLRAPLGVFGVLGNHDHYSGTAESVRQTMRRAGILDLTNCGIDIRREGQSLRVCGVGDLWQEKQHLGSALGGVRRAEAALLLSHNPDYVERIRDDRVGLVLSGHTHGGQCVLPLIGAPLLPSRFGQKYASGLCQGPATRVFVTTGVGHSFPPIRVNCPAEVALLTLTRSSYPSSHQL
ncbi:MAG: metallophosphoesterase [Verrucomicrobiota bacterium]